MKQLYKWLWQLSLYLSLVTRYRDRAQASEEAARVIARKTAEAEKAAKDFQKAEAFFETLQAIDRITEELASPKTKRSIETLGLSHGEIVVPIRSLEKLRDTVERRR